MQRTAVFSAAVLLLVMGTGLAFAAGAADSSLGSAPAVIESDRPVQRVPSAITSVTAGIAAPAAVKPDRSAKGLDKRTEQPNAARPSSSAHRKPRQTGGTAKKRRDDDERETVAPPVRDDDDDEDDHETVVPPVRDDDEHRESD